MLSLAPSSKFELHIPPPPTPFSSSDIIALNIWSDSVCRDHTLENVLISAAVLACSGLLTLLGFLFLRKEILLTMKCTNKHNERCICDSAVSALFCSINKPANGEHGILHCVVLNKHETRIIGKPPGKML